MGARVVGVALDRERRLFYRTQDVIDAEARMGRSITGLVASGGSVTDLVTLLWAGLRGEDPKLTPQALAKILDDVKRREGRSVYQLWEKVVEGLVASGVMPEQEAETPAADPTPGAV